MCSSPEFPNGRGGGRPREYQPPPRIDSDESNSTQVNIWWERECPWCSIGRCKFEAGSAEFGGKVEVQHRSFELAPDTPVDFIGTPTDYLSQRRAIPAEQVIQMLTDIAKSVGLEYDHEHVHQSNRVPSHELRHFV